MLAAERLATGIVAGGHGQRRPGAGDEFWQFRPAAPGEGLRAVDWRRSARSDGQFIREREQVTARPAVIWVAGGAGMRWRGGADRPVKRDRAALLALALGLVLLRGGEQVAALGQAPAGGRAGAERLARALVGLPADGLPLPDEHGVPAFSRLRPGQRALIISDFLNPVADWQAAFSRAATLGVRGVALQLIDPAEEAFPFEGAVRLRAPQGGAVFDSRNAAALAPAYRARLAEHRAALTTAAGAAGWVFGHDTTATPPATVLAWAAAAMAG